MEGDKYLVFRLGDELYGLPIGAVERIVGEIQVTRVPKAPPMVVGLFDQRGQTLVAIDLALRFGRSSPATGKNHVVVQWTSERIGLRIDEVEGIFPLPTASISEPPALLQGGKDPFLTGVAHYRGKLIALLDPNLVVPEGTKLPKQPQAA